MRKNKLRFGDILLVENGLFFYSKRHKGYGALVTETQNEITTQWIAKTQMKTKQNRLKFLFYAFYFCIFVCAILTQISGLNAKIHYLRGFLLVALFVSIGRFKFVSRTQTDSQQRLEAAMYMAINAFNDLKRPPNIPEIHFYSWFCNISTTSIGCQLNMSIFLLFLCSFISKPFYAIIVFEIMIPILYFLRILGIFNYFQKSSPVLPTEKELNMVIQGLTMWYEHEKKEQKN